MQQGDEYMAQHITFTDNDEELIGQIKEFQKTQNIRYFTEAVRILCKNEPSMSDVVKNLK